MDLEARPYSPQSTPAEVEAIRDRVTLHAEGIVLYRELPVMSPFSLDVMFARVEQLLHAHGCHYLIVDVTEGAPRPDPALRRQIREWVRKLTPPLRHIASITPKNPLLTIGAKFIQAMLPVSLSIHDTFDEAEEMIRHKQTRLRP